jgi:predicted RNase H-like nuclease (RuvC/YqgF family)
LENKATDEFLSPKSTTENETLEGQATSPAMTVEDPLGVSPINGSEGTEQELEKTGATPEAVAVVAEPPPRTAATGISGTGELEEKIKELSQQLATKTEQCLQLENSLGERANEMTKQKTDHDEKMKKMKAIFAAANKNLNEYRQSIAAKDEEIAELKSQLESRLPSEEQSNEQNRTFQYRWYLSKVVKGSVIRG